MADFHLDHDASATVLVTELTVAGHVARTSRQLGLAMATDAEQLLVAASLGWILVTRNAADFALLHDAWLRWPTAWQMAPATTHAGVLAIRQHPPCPFPTVARAIHSLVSSRGLASLRNNYLFLDTRTLTWLREPR